MAADHHQIKALLFDLGGVIVDIDFGRALDFWRPYSALTRSAMETRFEMDLPYQRHERGEIQAAEYFDHLRNRLSISADDEKIAAGWNAIFLHELTAITRLVNVASRHIPCFAFSNSNPTHQDYWEVRYAAALTSFRKVFVSSTLGLRKPEKAAFMAVAEAMETHLEHILFFDDTEENVLGARAIGMPAVWVRSPRDVSLALEQRGLLHSGVQPG